MQRPILARGLATHPPVLPHAPSPSPSPSPTPAKATLTSPHTTTHTPPMSESADREARRALQRLRRAVEKATHELSAVEGALRHAEAGDFPASAFAEAARRLRDVVEFIDEQAMRLEEKILQSGGLEPGRVRRTGAG